MAGIIVVSEVVVGAVIIYFLLRRRRPLVRAPTTADGTLGKTATVLPDESRKSGRVENSVRRDVERVETPKPQTDFVTAGSTLGKTATVLPDESRESGRVKNSVRRDAERAVNLKQQTDFVIVGGKIVIPRGDKSSDIEILYGSESHAIISVEYEPTNSHPRGIISVIVLGDLLEPEKSKEN